MNKELDRSNALLDFKKDVTRSVFTDFYQSIRQGGNVWKSFSDAAVKAVDRIINRLVTSGIDRLIENLFKAPGGLLGSLFRTVTSVAPASVAPAASGNPNLGRSRPIAPFANGGVFTNSIVSSPTMFQFANGGALGMMGEVEPEAIMPLKRGSDGSLGVQMHGGRNAAPQEVNVNVRTSKYLEAEIDQRAANVAGPMAVQGGMAGADLATQRISKARRNAIP